MKTTSSLVQDIVAKEYRRENTSTDASNAGKGGGEVTDPLEQSPFAENPQAWYEPDTEDPDEIVAVRIPEQFGLAEDRRYYKTYEGAAQAIRRFYEGSQKDARQA
jgi:hypothetical protein